MNDSNTKIIPEKDCPVRNAMDAIGGKWRIPIIWEISMAKSIRYNELKRNIPGITNIMLTRSLRSLEEYRIVIRTEFNTIPPHVEYSLTESCNDLLLALNLIHGWGKKMDFN